MHAERRGLDAHEVCGLRGAWQKVAERVTVAEDDTCRLACIHKTIIALDTEAIRSENTSGEFKHGAKVAAGSWHLYAYMLG